MMIRNTIAKGTLVCVLATAAGAMSTSVLASEAGAFIGGVFATKIVGNMRDRTEAEQQQAAAAQSMAQRPVETAPVQKSAEQRIAELDKLAAGGYITPEEYKAKKQQILDSM
jgi:hypothetical protein